MNDDLLFPAMHVLSDFVGITLTVLVVVIVTANVPVVTDSMRVDTKTVLGKTRNLSGLRISGAGLMSVVGTAQI